MIERDPFAEIMLALQGDTAAALGFAGKKLELAVVALVAFDSDGVGKPNERETLLRAAADALWAYVVQKELIGVSDNTKVNEVYGVTQEIWQCMGAIYQD